MKNKKTIANFAWYNAPYAGNFISQMLQLSQKVKELNYNFLLVLPEITKNREWCQEIIKKKTIDIIFIKNENSFLNRIKELRRLIKNENIILIHSHFGKIRKELLLVSILEKTKFIYHAREEIIEAKNKKDKLKQKIKYHVFYKNKYVVVLNKEMKERLKDYNFDIKNLIIQPNSIDFDRMKKINKSRMQIRTENQIKPQDYVVLMMGYNIEIKGVDIAVKAMQQIQDSEIVLAIVMATNQEKNMEQIKKMCGATVPNSIKLLAPTENIAEYYNFADCFLSASRTEGFSNSILEALYMKKAIIMSDIKGTKWAEQFDSVCTYHVSDAQELKERIKERKTEELIVDLEQIKQKVYQEYDVKIWAKKIANFYKNILIDMKN